MMAHAWQSELLKGNGEDDWTRQTVTLGDQRWSLPDFSYAGYQQGTAPLGVTVACRVENLDVKTGEEISAAMKAAIHRLAQAGGGILRLPSGDFLLSQSVGINASNIAIEGAGSQQTRLHVGRDYQPDDPLNEGVLSFGRELPSGWRQGWWSQAPEVAQLSRQAHAGDTSVHVDNSKNLRRGQWIVLSQALWSGASRQWTGGQWPTFSRTQRPTGAERLFAFVYLRRISDIEGLRIHLDAPLPWSLAPQDNPIRVLDPDQASTPMLEQVGLSGVSIEFENSSGPGRPLGAGVAFEGIRDGWLHDVVIRNIPRTGVRVTHSARISVMQSAVRHMQDGGGGGWGYGFDLFASQDILLRDTTAEQLRHGVTLSRMPTSNVVVSRHQSIGSTQDGDDSHHGPIQQVLFDQHQGLRGAGLRMVYRGRKSNGAHETLASGVVWNAGGDTSRGLWYGHGVAVDPIEAGWAMVIGVAPERWVLQDGRPIGEPPLRRVPTALAPQQLPGLAGRGPGRASGNVYYEGIGHAGLTPASLYQAQLKARTGKSVAGYRSDCEQSSPARPAPEPVTAPAPALLFKRGAQSAVLRMNPDYARLDRDATVQPAQTWIRITDDARAWTPLVTLRHTLQPAGSISTLRIRLRTNRSAEMRVQLASPTLPHQQRSLEGSKHLRVEAGDWQVIDLPLPPSARKQSFDTVMLKASGQRSGAIIEIDQIELR
ncbi:MAG: hypothetical protein VX549_14260 [Pseudomonadota bacterium]|nr:hypothetical protein [Pseudomonadota bacterium]